MRPNLSAVLTASPRLEAFSFRNRLWRCVSRKGPSGRVAEPASWLAIPLQLPVGSASPETLGRWYLLNETADSAEPHGAEPRESFCVEQDSHFGRLTIGPA